MDADLATTNLSLGVMPVASALEALALIAIGVALFVLIRRMVRLIDFLEAQIAPAGARVRSILDDVKEMTSRGEDERGLD